MTELNPEDEFRLEEIWKSLNLSRKLYESKRRARAQEVFREALTLLGFMPAKFTSSEIDTELARLFKLLF